MTSTTEVEGQRKMLFVRRLKMQRALDAKLAAMPEVWLVHGPGYSLVWQTFSSRFISHDYRAYRFADRWARLMQIELAKGKTVSEVALATKEEASFGNLPDRHYLNAVVMLTMLWRYGNELHYWAGNPDGLRQAAATLGFPESWQNI